MLLEWALRLYPHRLCTTWAITAATNTRPSVTTEPSHGTTASTLAYTAPTAIATATTTFALPSWATKATSATTSPASLRRHVPLRFRWSAC